MKYFNSFSKIFGHFLKYLHSSKNIYRPGVRHAGGHSQRAADLRERHAAVQVDHPLHVQPRTRAGGQVRAHVRRGPEVERAASALRARLLRRASADQVHKYF